MHFRYYNYNITTFVILFDGEKIKGAQRWFFIGGFSFQPSEIGNHYM